MPGRNALYRCSICGNVVELLAVGRGTLTCCGQPMAHLVENTVEASREKHVPVITPVAGGYRVAVGSVPHPMVDAHHIPFIDLLTKDAVLRRFLMPGEAPEVTFCTDATQVTARAWCNLHGLWTA
jgi:superoxide reductase